MAAEQVKIRRDSNTNLIAATPADGEIAYDQTNKRITIGDASKAGGAPIPNYIDIHNQVFTAVAAGGTADALTLTFTTQFAPSAYATFQRFVFSASATNTTTATINVNALGAKTIKKIVSDAKQNLDAGDITNGLLYEITYDGTDFILMNSGSGLDDSVTGDQVEAYAHVLSANASVGTTYTKVTEIEAGRSGVYNVRISAKSGSDGNHKLKIYKNGAAEGTERSGLTATSDTWDEDITVSAGDLVQLYAKANSGTVDIGGAALQQGTYGNAAMYLLTGNPAVSAASATYITTVVP